MVRYPLARPAPPSRRRTSWGNRDSGTGRIAMFARTDGAPVGEVARRGVFLALRDGTVQCMGGGEAR